MRKVKVFKVICNILTTLWVIGIILLGLVATRNEELGAGIFKMYELIKKAPYPGTLEMLYSKVAEVALFTIIIMLPLSGLFYGLRNHFVKTVMYKNIYQKTKKEKVAKSVKTVAPEVITTSDGDEKQVNIFVKMVNKVKTPKKEKKHKEKKPKKEKDKKVVEEPVKEEVKEPVKEVKPSKPVEEVKQPEVKQETTSSNSLNDFLKNMRK